jgi:ferredoxin-type protein NapH
MIATAPFQSATLSLSKPNPYRLGHKISLGLIAVGFLFLAAAALGEGSRHPLPMLVGCLTFITLGTLGHTHYAFGMSPAGIKNHGIMRSGLTARGAIAWIIAVFLTGFYCLMYWHPSSLVHLTRMLDPVSQLLRSRKSDVYFMYGFLYTIAILLMGIRAAVKYRHSSYQLVRTGSIVFFQLIFAFMIPSLLAYFREPERYPSFFWPLSYKDLFPETVHSLMTHPGQLGKFLLLWSVMLAFVATPILTYFFGKRWYCSWVCGCGGLANTLGDPWRQLSDKSLKAWKVERVLIYSVLALITLTTGLLWIGAWSGPGAMQSAATGLKQFYGFAIGMVFSGVVGTGFYPIMGTRVWCRFGCPQAAILGILQRFFSRFRITTNGAQCISCGNCSTYCEMGIDVRAYAQKGQNIVRASCVGCGLCSAVCPRGVLNLENGPREGRVNSSLSLTDELKAG